MRHSKTSYLRLLPALTATLTLLAACASMGRPEGGPRDMTPPVYLRSNPAPGARNINANRIVVEFDENVSLDDAMNKVVVSPAQHTTPRISSLGKKVTVELRDTLIPDATYTIDFADAIRDLNESNVLDGFAIDFSTGPDIDSLRISGMVLEARTLEPAQGILVGVYSNLSDTAFTTLPLERITKTNQLGQFTIRGLKPIPYRIFALNDINRDYHWDRSEDVAFYHTTITPSAQTVEITDTLLAANGTDSLITRQTTKFLPDDILLTWFNQDYKAQYLKDHTRPDPRRLNLIFSAPADTLPQITLLNTHRAGEPIDKWALLDASTRLDTLTYWLRDTSLMTTDTLLLQTRYLRTDTLDQLTLTTDTLKFILKGHKNKKKPKKKKSDEETDTLPPAPDPLEFKIASPAAQELNQPLQFTTPTPLDTINTTAITLEIEIDSVWHKLPMPTPTRTIPTHLLEYQSPFSWEPGMKYRLTIDSAAITDIYGLVNKPITHEFTAKKREDYSTLTFTITGHTHTTHAMAELLTQSDDPVATTPVNPDGKAIFEYLNPGTYYCRLYIDADSSHTWTTGLLPDSLQPEETYYYPKKITLKKNWDVMQTWDINELPVDTQKPMEIRQNKPKRKKWDDDDKTGKKTNRYSDDDDDYDDPYFSNDPFLGGNSNRRGRM